MEHRHIPAGKGSGIPDTRTVFRRGEENLLDDVWFSRCAVCGELICPPKYWRRLRGWLRALILGPIFSAIILLLAHKAPKLALGRYLLCNLLFAIFDIAWEFMLNAYLAYGEWQPFPKGLEGKKLRQRTDRKGGKKRLFELLYTTVYLSILTLRFFF